MRILFLSHYFPPEVNAPASRTHEMCRRWVRDGHAVTVITAVPNHPNGVVYAGYRNRPVQVEEVDGIRVIRLWTFLTPNQGRKRVLSFLSYMGAVVLAGALIGRPDVMIATTPQPFCGLAGALVAWLRRLPFILEVRDLWPESIVAMGAMKRSALGLRALRAIERFIYWSADRIVTVGDGYKDQLVARGLAADLIDVVPNGIDRELFEPGLPDRGWRRGYGLDSRFVCAYTGTIGMAAGLEIVLRAARLLKASGRHDVAFLLVGDGALKEPLETAAAEKLDNVVFTGRVDRQQMPRVLASVDACFVHLRRVPLFESVLPSKIFEAAGMERPIILGVRGHAAQLIEQAGAGICIEPENEQELVAAVERLAADPDLRTRLGRAGRRFVLAHHDRDVLSKDYLRVLASVVAAPRPRGPSKLLAGRATSREEPLGRNAVAS